MGINSLKTNLTNCSYMEEDYKFVFLIFETIAVLVIVCGNVLIIGAVCRFKMLRSPSNIMVASLAVGDLLMGGVYLPMKMFLASHDYELTEKHHCLLNTTVSFFCVGLAMAFLSMLSIERFYAVQFPFHYHSTMTVTRSLIWSGITLVGTFILVLPIFCGIDVWTPHKPCLSFVILPAYYIWTVGFVVFIILLCGFLSFVRVLIAEIGIQRQNEAQNLSDLRRIDSVKCTLMLLVYVFSLICWIPPLIYVIISVANPRISTNKNIIRAMSLVGLSSSWVNCFIYGIKNSKFRAAFKKMFGFHSLGNVAPAVSGTELNT